MFDLWPIEISLSGIIEKLIVCAIVAGLVYVNAKYLLPWWRQKKADIDAEVAKRTRSTEYFYDRERAVIIHLIIVFGTGIAALQMFHLGRPWSIMMWPMLALEYAAIYIVMKERTLNKRALLERMSIEEEKPPSKRGRSS